MVPVRLIRAILRGIWAIGWRLGVVVAIVIALATAYYVVKLPPAQKLLDGRSRGSVTMIDDQGNTFAWRGLTYDQISAKNVSPYLRDAVVATEDKRFWHDFGISPRGILGAMLINIRDGRGPFEGHGGSTITQQVSKLLCLGQPFDPSKWKNEKAYQDDCRRSTIWRKIQEVPYSFALEWKYTKDQILTIYLNRAYLGAGASGFEAASQRYFGISAKKLDPAQAAMLAGLLKAPSYYAPTSHLKRAQERADVVLDLMTQQGYLTLAQEAQAKAHPATLSTAAESRAGGYFADWVMDSLPSFLSSQTTEDVTIKTTMDPQIQKAAESAVSEVLDKKLKKGSKVQVAVVVMSPDGAVRAMVGGRKVEPPGGFNRAVQAERQTGSAFKPFVYAVAMDEGYSPADYVEDTPLTVHRPGSPPWSPKNYERNYEGLVTLTTALKKSLNVPAVRVAIAVGLDKVREVAKELGLTTELAQGPAVALGVSNATLLDMTGAYAGILNLGQAVKPYGMVSLSLRGDNTPLMGQTGGAGQQVIKPDAAKSLIYMMNQVVESGTGRNAKLPDREAAGKTGTSQNERDAWFIGFTSNYVAGIWIGNDDNSPMRGHYTGGTLPAEIWHAIMMKIDKEKNAPVIPLPMAEPTPRLPPKVDANGNAGVGGNAGEDRGGNIAQKILSDVSRLFGGNRR
ncbi:glycosyl transferase [Defluviimonas sp. 20V17]|uniref:peptidoglycan glycosyltransferase n=1 Tax=Allgaiera indica TaxID=765699 RepID=A0AAN4UUW7_9RHOB|nr:PBP1A family penicillin-binding protein [Allgaiera indica]KDB04888.1 glycosyl transferase [Defluviimonas sp. 20V17]GHE05586.1 glycosyl transferase family 51 [Allgaiera indica]SDX77521.1 penicillin-binding protein, 1A family [Allgaiera indica]